MTKLFKKLLKLIWWILFISFFVLFVFLWNSSSVDTNPLVFDLSERMRSRRWVLPIFPLIMTCLIFVNLFVDWPQKLSRWFRDVLGIIILASLSLFLAAQVSLKIDKYRNLIEKWKPTIHQRGSIKCAIIRRASFRFSIRNQWKKNLYWVWESSLEFSYSMQEKLHYKRWNEVRSH